MKIQKIPVFLQGTVSVVMLSKVMQSAVYAMASPVKCHYTLAGGSKQTMVIFGKFCPKTGA